MDVDGNGRCLEISFVLASNEGRDLFSTILQYKHNVQGKAQLLKLPNICHIFFKIKGNLKLQFLVHTEGKRTRGTRHCLEMGSFQLDKHAHTQRQANRSFSHSFQSDVNKLLRRRQAFSCGTDKSKGIVCCLLNRASV